MADYDASIRVNTKISTEKAQEQLKAFENKLEKLRQKTEALSKKKEQMEVFNIETSEYQEQKKKLAEATEKYRELLEQRKQWQELGFENKGTAWDAALRKENEASRIIDGITIKMKELESSGKAFTNQIDTDAYRKVCDDLTNVVNETDLLKMKTEHLRDQFSVAQKSARKCFGILQKDGMKANGLLTTMLSRFKGIALSLLVFNWISKGFNAMVSAMQKGFQNLAHYSKEYNDAMSDMKSESATLKNSLAAAFEPIVTMIIPYITTLISWLNTAMNYLAQFWAALSGKSTYTRAKKQVVDYAKSLKDAGSTAKGALAAFDELNVLSKNNSSSAGGEVTGADAFEEAEVDQSKFAWVDWLRDNLNIILGIVELIGIGFLAWKLESAIFANLDKLMAILGHLNLVFGIAMAAAGAFILLKDAVDAWQNGIDWDNLNGMLIGATLLVAGLGLAFGGVGLVVGSLIAGIVLLVVGFKDAINNGLNLKNTLAIIAGTFLIVLAAVNSVFGSIVTLMAGVALLIISFKDMMENGVNLQNSLMAIAGTFLTVSSIAGAAVGAIAALVAGLVLAIVADWNNFKQMVVVPLQAWLEALLANAGETLEGIKGILRGIIQFLKGVFTADWRLAWTGIKNIFNGIWKAISGTVKLVVNAIIGIINTMVNGLAGAINAVINAINSLNFTVPDWVPFFGGETYQGFNIPTLPAPANIPYLEYGGTVTQETYAKISEGNRKEVVLPLEQHTEWADLLADKIGTRGTTVIRFEGSLAELGRVLKPVIDSENSRVGVSLAQN